MDQKPTIIERAILANQFKILAALNNDQYEKENYLIKATILEKGYESSYYEIFNRVTDETVSSEISGEVLSILDMFRHIKWTTDKLTEEEKSNLNLKKLTFRGFDASNGKHFHYLAWWDEQNPNSTYREDLGAIGGFNSHSEIPLAEYRGMLEVYKTFDFSGPSRLLTIEELQQLQKAQTLWPDKNFNI